MDRNNDEISQKRPYSRVDKGKGIMVDNTNDEPHKQARHQQNPPINRSSSPSVLLQRLQQNQQQNQQQIMRPLSAGNSYSGQATRLLNENNLNLNSTRNASFQQFMRGTGNRGPMFQFEAPTVGNVGGVILHQQPNVPTVTGVEGVAMHQQSDFPIVRGVEDVHQQSNVLTFRNAEGVIQHHQYVKGVIQHQQPGFPIVRNVEGVIQHQQPRVPTVRNVEGVIHHQQPNVPIVRYIEGQLMYQRFLESQAMVQRISKFWPYMKCSLILDSWTDMTGRTYLDVTVDCPQGSVYLQSLDLTYAVGDVLEMESIVYDILDVYTNPLNVYQVISFAGSPWLNTVGQRVRARYPWIFWTVNATSCLTLILKRVASSIAWVNKTIEEAELIIRAIHGEPYILQILRNCSNLQIDYNFNLVKTAKFKEATPFLTLKNLLHMQEKLKILFASKEWTNSSFGSSSIGRQAARLVVRDTSFWTRVTLVVEASAPIIDVLCYLNNGNTNIHEPQMGYIYEKMDEMKEKIRDTIGTKRANSIWAVIDDIWDNMLHSPLHAAGFYLNPKLLYKQRFLVDQEVEDGVMNTIIKIGGSRDTHSIKKQLYDYRFAYGDFKEGYVEKDEYSPAKWWMKYGNQCKELQNFAITVLGLTCSAAPPHMIGREVASRMLSTRATDPLYPWLTQNCYVTNNLRLKWLKMFGYQFTIEANEPPHSGGRIVDH